MKFTWARKTGEAGFTNAEVELLLNDHEKFLVANEIGPLRDKLTTVETELATTTKGKDTALAELQAKYDTLEGELQPIKAEKHRAAQLETIKGLNKLNPETLNDAVILAGINLENDTEADIIKKIDAFVNDEKRAQYKFVAPNAETKTETRTIVPEKTGAQIAAITHTANVVNDGGLDIVALNKQLKGD